MTDAELEIARNRLTDAAKRRSLVTYTELAGLVGLDMDDPRQQKEFTHALERLAEMDIAAGEPWLVALLIRDDTKAPGRGLFKFAKARRSDTRVKRVPLALVAKILPLLLRHSRGPYLAFRPSGNAPYLVLAAS